MANYRSGEKFLILCQNIGIPLYLANSDLGNSGDVLDPSAALIVQLLETALNPTPPPKQAVLLSLSLPPAFSVHTKTNVSFFFPPSAREKATLFPPPFL